MNDVAARVTSGDWVAPGLAKATLTALDAEVTPLRDLDAAGLDWLVPHVQPLQDAVRRMAGRSNVIEAFADTWTRTADAVARVRTDVDRSVTAETREWAGEAADGYRGHSREIGASLVTVATVAAATGAVARTLGEACADARQRAGALLSDLVGRLISYGTQAMAAEGVTADVVAQAAGMVAGYASPIAALEAKAHESANAVTPLLRAMAGTLGAPPTAQGGVTRTAAKAIDHRFTPPPTVPGGPRVPPPWGRLNREDQAEWAQWYSDFYDNWPESTQTWMRNQIRAYGIRHPTASEVSDAVAEVALRHGPPGTLPFVTRDGAGPTVQFFAPGDHNRLAPLVMRQTVSVVPGSNVPFPTEVSLTAAMGNITGGRPETLRELWVQVPAGTTDAQIAPMIEHLSRENPRNTMVVFMDPDGVALAVAGKQKL